MKDLIFKSVLVGFALVSLLSPGAVTIGPNATITFESGRSALTNDSERKLLELVKEARSKGKIDEIKVAVWSDNPTPREGDELSKVDRDLAAARVDAIQNFLKRHKVTDVEAYNMAERASWLSRVFNTEAADFKSETGSGNEAPMFKEEFQIFKTNGTASKAVLISLVKHRP